MAYSLIAYKLLVIWAGAPSPATFSPQVLQPATGPLPILWKTLTLLLALLSWLQKLLWQGWGPDGPVHTNHLELLVNEVFQVSTQRLWSSRPGVESGTWWQVTQACARSGAQQCCVPGYILGSLPQSLLYFCVPNSHGGRTVFYFPCLSPCLEYGRHSVKRLLFES